jgi:hypothetical protein
MQQVWNFWKAIFGEKLLILFFILLCIGAASAVIYPAIKSKLTLERLGIINVICLGGFIFAWRQPYFPEKTHVLEFALLGWLTVRDLTRQNKRFLKGVFFAFIFVAIIGCLEEGFQKLLPWRVCELRDMITDALSGALGIILNLLSQTRLSSLIRSF